MQRRHVWFHVVAWLMILLVGCQPISAPTSPSQPTATLLPAPTTPPPTRILFIGDSLSGWSIGLDTYVRGLAGSSQPPLELETFTVFAGAATLERQWERGKALEEIRTGNWQVFVIQEDLAMSTSNTAFFDAAVARFHHYARQFAVEIELTSGEIVFYANQEYGYPLHKTAEDFHVANVDIAEAVDAQVAPVGLAWTRVRAVAPEIELYYADRIHPSPAGMYLTAAVLYATIYERSPEGLTWLPTDDLSDDKRLDDLRRELTITPETRDFLLTIAWEVVQENAIR